MTPVDCFLILAALASYALWIETSEMREERDEYKADAAYWQDEATRLFAARTHDGPWFRINADSDAEAVSVLLTRVGK